MLTMAHSNPARVQDGVLYVDRKFHTGMQEYAKYLDLPLVSLNPWLAPARDRAVMDLVALPERELGYRVVPIVTNDAGVPQPGEEARVWETLRDSRVIYGSGLGTRALARKAGIPTVPVLEYNVKTTLVFARAGVPGRIKRNVQSARALNYYLREMVPTMRQAALLHCNGYPVFEESAWFNRNRLLYLDSRMRQDMIISEDALEQRLRQRSTRPPRLIYSGRFEPAKGALDVVKVAAACHQRGQAFEAHLYGQGSLRDQMLRTVAEQGLQGKVVIHDPVPFPELVTIAKGFDVFICCHIQDDPSCTYLESMGCGLPVVGYENAMWRGVAKHSQAGTVTPPHKPDQVATSLMQLLNQPGQLETLSRRARSFAVEHSFEREYVRRTDSLRALYQQQETKRAQA